MPADRVDIFPRRGVTFRIELDYRDSTGAAINTSAYTAAMQIRSRVTPGNVWASLSNTSGLTLGGANGAVVILVAASALANVPTGVPGQFDLTLTAISGGEVIDLASGNVLVSASVLAP